MKIYLSSSKIMQDNQQKFFKRAILLVDMNAFFAQVEQINNPLLKGKPVLVSGSAQNRTVVTAASYEAKKYGIKSGMSLPEAKTLCPNAILIEGNADKYLSYCQKNLEIYKEFTDLVEPYSIDEAFLDITRVQKLFGTPEEIALKIKQKIKNKLGLTCSVGIAPNKLFAKMASNFKKPDGLTVFYAEQIPQVIWHLKIKELFGVGTKMEKHLNNIGIFTIQDLALYPENILKIKFGKYGEMLHNFAQGIDNSLVDPESYLNYKSLGHSYTLPYNTDDILIINWFLFFLADKISRRMLKLKVAGKTLSLFVRTHNFFSFSRAKTLNRFIYSPQDIYQNTRKIFFQNFKNEKIRMLGISISGLASLEKFQLDLFTNDEKNIRVLKVMEKIKNKYGERAVSFLGLKEKENLLRKKTGCFLTREEKYKRDN